MNKIYSIIIVPLLLLTLVGVGYLVFDKSESFGSVSKTNEYQSTSTAGMSGVLVKAAEFNQLIKTATYGSVVLNSVIVASTTAESMSIFNASSTDAIANGDGTLIVTFPTSTPQGTYVFDTELNQGLVVQLQAGHAGAYIITYR